MLCAMAPTEDDARNLRLRTWFRRRFRTHPWWWNRVVGPGIVVAERVGTDALGVQAGSMTYGAFLSIPPLLLIFVSLTSTVLRNDPELAARVIDGVTSAIPGLDEIVTANLAVDSRLQLGAGILGVLTVIWAASGFGARTRFALGIMFRTPPGGLTSGRIVAGLIGIPVVLGFVLILGAGAALGATFDRSDISVGAELGVTILELTAGFSLAVLTQWLLTPGDGPRPRELVPGAILFAVGWLVLQSLGSAYVTRVVQQTTAIYGAIGAVFGVLAFLYVTMWLFLISAEVSQVFRDRAFEDELPSEPTPG